MKHNRCILIANGCCWYFYRKDGWWWRKAISSSDKRYKSPIFYNMDDVGRYMRGTIAS